MGLFSWYWESKKNAIVHNDVNETHLATIPNDTRFTREGNGTTIVTGSVGHSVHLSILEGGSLTIRGDIGNYCSIYKDGNGTLIIEGVVADSLKLTVYGQGSITFTQQPPERVIKAIKNPGGIAQITCAGTVLPPPNQGYLHHNLGEAVIQPPPEPRPLPQPREVVYHPHPVVAQPKPSSSKENEVVDQYPEITETYIETYRERKNKTIAERIAELKLNPQEKEEFFGERFQDPITMNYFDDIPIFYDERFYNLSTLLIFHKTNKPDPFVPNQNKPLKLANFMPARTIYNEVDEAIQKLKKQREAAAKAAAAIEEQSSVSPSM